MSQCLFLYPLSVIQDVTEPERWWTDTKGLCVFGFTSVKGEQNKDGALKQNSPWFLENLRKISLV